MRLSATFARVLLSGTVLGLGACSTTVVDRDAELKAERDALAQQTAEQAIDPAQSRAGPQTQANFQSRTTQQDAVEISEIVFTAEPVNLGGEPQQNFASNTNNVRQLTPMHVPTNRERFAETGPVSTDGLTQVSFAQEGEDFDPALTPDGKFIVFASTQHRATSDIFIKPVKGSVITQLTNDPSDDAMPSVSPDGKRVAFASNRSGTWNIYIMPIGGGKPVQITASAAHDLHPSWSPDSSTLVFSRLGEVSRRWELWTVEASNPSSQSFLGYGMLPQWCPKSGTGIAGGDRILFQLPRERGARTFGVWAMDYKDGTTSNPMAIVTSNDSALINPTWSPDGRFIVYAEVPAPTGRVEINQTRPTQADLWMTAVDGSARVRLTDGNAVALMPNWNGNRLVFFSDRGGRGNIWTMDTTSAALACGGAQAESPAHAARPAAPGSTVHSMSHAVPVKGKPAETQHTQVEEITNVVNAEEQKHD